MKKLSELDVANDNDMTIFPPAVGNQLTITSSFICIQHVLRSTSTYSLWIIIMITWVLTLWLDQVTHIYKSKDSFHILYNISADLNKYIVQSVSKTGLFFNREWMNPSIWMDKKVSRSDLGLWLSKIHLKLCIVADWWNDISIIRH